MTTIKRDDDDGWQEKRVRENFFILLFEFVAMKTTLRDINHKKIERESKLIFFGHLYPHHSVVNSSFLLGKLRSVASE
jgi:hypothetical protein